jgi:hypothetical protein
VLGDAAARTVRERFDAFKCERAFHERVRGLLAEPLASHQK